MQKQKIKTIAVSGTNQWKDRILTKHFIQFEDMTNGTLTTGFDDTPPPVVGASIEYELVDNGYGIEVKLPRKGGAFKGGAKWTPEQVAQQDAIKLTVAYLTQRSDISDWNQFFIEAKAFVLQQIKVETPKVETVIDEKELPF